MLNRQFNSKNGLCIVNEERMHKGVLCYLIKCGSSNIRDIVPATELDRWIELEEARYKDELKYLERVRIQQETELEAKRKREDIGPYGLTLTALQRGKAVAALEKKFRYQGQELTRRQIMDQIIASGGKIITAEGGRAITTGAETYLTEKTMGKTAFDYAEHQIGNQ